MASVFWRQFLALLKKNWIILSKHPLLNLLSCLLLPIGFGVFLAFAQNFFHPHDKLGLGEPAPFPKLNNEFGGSLSLPWVDLTNGTATPSAVDIMSHIMAGFSSSQSAAIKQVHSMDDLNSVCRPNWNGISGCFAGVSFDTISNNGTFGYTIYRDDGIHRVDVAHKSDFERRVASVQVAIEKAIVQLKTGVELHTPLDWAFAKSNDDLLRTTARLSWVAGIQSLTVLLFFICYIGITYQLSGSYAGERANLLTAHLKAMGLLDSARILSWHISHSLAYLPAWIIVAVIWQHEVFTGTNAGIMILVHLLLGFSMASWSLFVSAFFGNSPQLAAAFTTVIAILLAVMGLVLKLKTAAASIFSLIFPPAFYIYTMRAICSFELTTTHTSLIRPSPDEKRPLTIWPLLLVAFINIFLWPFLAVMLERILYDARNSRASRRSQQNDTSPLPEDVAISINNLGKTYFSGLLRRPMTAVKSLSMAIPMNGIFVLVGSNGAGKSTTLSILAGLTGRTSGSIRFRDGGDIAERGTLGIVPQKNVLFPELTCYQTLMVWKAVKHSKYSPPDEDVVQLLTDCDLGAKLHSNAGSLSGGQKRKLQLAIGLIGGSKLILVDECTSGVDPLSRRALWRTLTAHRDQRTIIFTTHFLDEADLLADNIAILAAPGRLVASGTPVSLKRELGDGYSVSVSFDHHRQPSANIAPQLLNEIRAFAPESNMMESSPQLAVYRLKSKDIPTVQAVLQHLDERKSQLGIYSYDVLSTSVEDVFLKLMKQCEGGDEMEMDTLSKITTQAAATTPSVPLHLDHGHTTSPLKQAMVIFYKRFLILRRSWLGPLMMLAIMIIGGAGGLGLLIYREPQACGQMEYDEGYVTPVFLPESFYRYGLVPYAGAPPEDPQTAEFPHLLTFPPGIVHTLGNITSEWKVMDVADNATFIEDIKSKYDHIQLGGISLDLTTGDVLVGWVAEGPGFITLLNLANNILYNHALNSTGKSSLTPTFIKPSLGTFATFPSGTLIGLQWAIIYGAVMAVAPAFAALYVARERRSSVQAMQFSNGLTNPIGLWLGHLLHDIMFPILASTVIVIVLAQAGMNQFFGLGFFWLVAVLYAIASTLFAYCVTLMTASPLAAVAWVAGTQVIFYAFYIAGCLLTMTYADALSMDSVLTKIHFTLGLLSPVASIARSSFITLNLFSLLCQGDSMTTASDEVSIKRYGGPILYLVVWSIVLFITLVSVDTGIASLIPQRFRSARKRRGGSLDDPLQQRGADGKTEYNRLLDVEEISKTFGKHKVLDRVSMGIAQNTIYGLLGPNGAGKTTALNIIRGDVTPDSGDVFIDDTSVITDPKTARLSLGVCPQFTAIDSELTTREHLIIYGRLKGIGHGEKNVKAKIAANVDAIMMATGLSEHADKLATRLSGGNQRKLALAIALMGNPPVLLIDEFSSGVDAKMKREMWGTLRNIAAGKAVVITTHSMEEASALANEVGIIAKRMLVEGTPRDLTSRYAAYEIQFSCRNREDIVKVRELMSSIPGSKMSDDVATRFEVPISDGSEDSTGEVTGSKLTLAQLFKMLSHHGGAAGGSDAEDWEFTVEKTRLETIFLRVIRENNAVVVEGKPSV